MSGLNLLARGKPGFPPPESALKEPNGLLAVGGALNPDWLITAYRHGVFPWFEDDRGPLLWWSPDPRAILYPDAIKISRSLAKRLRNAGFRVTLDTAFRAVIESCAESRVRAGRTETGTWITRKMIDAYTELHELGLAHAVEVWLEDELVGGLYGVSLGRMFFGESMFSREKDASKVALSCLCKQMQQWDYLLIDCQVSNPHLVSLGAIELPRSEFVAKIEWNADQPTRQGSWSMETDTPL